MYLHDMILKFDLFSDSNDKSLKYASNVGCFGFDMCLKAEANKEIKWGFG